jgi:hypothetical protein
VFTPAGSENRIDVFLEYHLLDRLGELLGFQPAEVRLGPVLLTRKASAMAQQEG